MEKEKGDAFSQSIHVNLEELFKSDIPGLVSYVLGANITEEQIEKDEYVKKLVDNDGQCLYITPSAISTALAGLEPKFKVVGQREEIYKNLQKGCDKDLREEGLLQPVPEILKNKDFGHEM